MKSPVRSDKQIHKRDHVDTENEALQGVNTQEVNRAQNGATQRPYNSRARHRKKTRLLTTRHRWKVMRKCRNDQKNRSGICCNTGEGRTHGFQEVLVTTTCAFTTLVRDNIVTKVGRELETRSCLWSRTRRETWTRNISKERNTT